MIVVNNKMAYVKPCDPQTRADSQRPQELHRCLQLVVHWVHRCYLLDV